MTVHTKAHCARTRSKPNTVHRSKPNRLFIHANTGSIMRFPLGTLTLKGLVMHAYLYLMASFILAALVSVWAQAILTASINTNLVLVSAFYPCPEIQKLLAVRTNTAIEILVIPKPGGMIHLRYRISWSRELAGWSVNQHLVLSLFGQPNLGGGEISTVCQILLPHTSHVLFHAVQHGEPPDRCLSHPSPHPGPL